MEKKLTPIKFLDILEGNCLYCEQGECSINRLLCNIPLLTLSRKVIITQKIPDGAEVTLAKCDRIKRKAL